MSSSIPFEQLNTDLETALDAFERTHVTGRVIMPGSEAWQELGSDESFGALIKAAQAMTPIAALNRDVYANYMIHLPKDVAGKLGPFVAAGVLAQMVNAFEEQYPALTNTDRAIDSIKESFSKVAPLLFVFHRDEPFVPRAPDPTREALKSQIVCEWKKQIMQCHQADPEGTSVLMEEIKKYGHMTSLLAKGEHWYAMGKRSCKPK
jgi:hypothetical protein